MPVTPEELSKPVDWLLFVGAVVVLGTVEVVVMDALVTLLIPMRNSNIAGSEGMMGLAGMKVPVVDPLSRGPYAKDIS